MLEEKFLLKPLKKLDMPNIFQENEVAVVVPVYQSKPTEQELSYLYHNIEILKNFPFLLVAPQGLDINAYKKTSDIKVEFFPPHYFNNIAGYNKLMLSSEFYTRFVNYKYILICQLDAFIFTNNLLSWCKKGYDYIGAPWVNKPYLLLSYVLVKTGITKALYLLLKHNINSAVGNGGLSLRKVSTFTSVSQQHHPDKSWPANEDFYWSFFAKTKGKLIKKPKANEASLFSIEVSPEKIMKYQNYTLPMGIHAWQRYSSNFWEKYINAALSKVEKAV